MNNKPTCHPENPESGQQTNRQAKLDTCWTCKHSQPLDPLFFGETVYCCLKKHYRYATTCDLYEPARQSTNS